MAMATAAARRPLVSAAGTAIAAGHISRAGLLARPAFLHAAAAKNSGAARTGPIARQIALTRQHGARRGYADGGQAPSIQLSPQPPKKTRWRLLRWTWRLTLLGTLGGIVYVAYGIYENRNPPVQYPPDPSKKTLVVLGESGMGICRGRYRDRWINGSIGNDRIKC